MARQECSHWGANRKLFFPLAICVQEANATPQIGPIICAHCTEPVCSESKWYCKRHLLLNRERSRASWRRIKERRKAERGRKKAGSVQPSRKRKAA